MVELSKGIIPKLFREEHTKSDGPVILQAVAVKTINFNDGKKIRVKMSDGQYENQMGMIQPENIEVKDCSELTPFSVFKLTSWSITGVTDKAILRIENFEIVQKPESKTKIGNPSTFKFTGEAAKMETNFPKKQHIKDENKENKKPEIQGGRYMAIQALTPYMNKWTIKGRITQKGDMREWNNARGSGKLFSFTIADETCDLKVTAFKEDAEKFIQLIEKGKVYQITNGQLKAKNPKFNQTAQDYELTLGRTSIIDQLEEDENVPKQLYNFVKIDQLEKKEKYDVVDILAVLKSADENVSMILIKSKNTESPKRELTLVDDSMKSVKCTLWGDLALNFDMSNIGRIVALKDASVGDFGGRSLSLGRNGEIEYQLEDSRVQQLEQWWKSGQNSDFGSLSQGSSSRNETFVALSTLNNGENYQSDKPYYFTAKGIVTFIKKDNMLYKACPGKDNNECKKKLIDEGNGNYRCEKCDITTPQFVYRMIMNAQVGDISNGVYITFFAEQGEQVLNCKSADLGAMMEDIESENYDNTVQEALFSEIIVNGRAKMETYQDEQRCKVTAAKVADVDYLKYGNQLMVNLTTEGHFN